MAQLLLTITTSVAGCLLSLGFLQDIAAADPYVTNRAPLQSQPYTRLPLGCVKAQSWLKHQLELQKDGLTGHAEELYDDIGKSDWISDSKRGGQYGWERGPYYAKGLIALAYVLDDQGLKDKSKKWIDQIIKSQRSDGNFGPTDKNFWANMIVLHYFRDYYEVSGDARVLDFLEKYFRFQLQSLPTVPLSKDSKWATDRGGDNLEIVLWLYNLKGEKWLMDLAHIIMDQTSEWARYYADKKGKTAYGKHIVNVMQGMKTPPLIYLISGDETNKAGFWNATRPDGWLMKLCGRVEGMASGTEPITDTSSTQGTELCAVVERILSTTVALSILGDAYIGDQLELVAYNALPAGMSRDIKGVSYYQLPNQPKCTNEKLGFANNGQDKSAICQSPHSGFACCRSNFHFGWPKFVSNMWMATLDNGLALTAYGPNTLTAHVGTDAKMITIDQVTDYPFLTDSTLTIHTTEPVAFPLELRIPSWCANPSVQVNGTPQKDVIPGKFYRIQQTWNNSDVIHVSFPMIPKISHWINGSAAITRGPLVFSLMIEGERKSTKEYLNNQFHTYEITPTSPWNYALLLDTPDTLTVETIISKSMPTQPFKAVDAPVKLKLKAFKTSDGGWGTYLQNTPARAVEPPLSPIKRTGNIEEVILAPYGASEIRITYFPWATE